MDPQSDVGTPEALRSGARFHVLGAGPVGLLLTALLQPLSGVSVRLYEKRRDYTRPRMVWLGSYLAADSVEAYRADHSDGTTWTLSSTRPSSPRALRSGSRSLRT